MKDDLKGILEAQTKISTILSLIFFSLNVKEQKCADYRQDFLCGGYSLY